MTEATRPIDRFVVIIKSGKWAHAHAARPQEVEGRLVVQVHGIENDAKMASTYIGARGVCTEKGEQTRPGPEQPLEAVGLALDYSQPRRRGDVQDRILI